MHIIAAARIPYRVSYKPTSANERHVVLCGNLSSSGVERFAEEFFHADSASNGSRMIVLLSPVIDNSLELILNKPTNKHRMHFICGSPQISTDLSLAKAHNALAIFLLSNVQEETRHEEDSVLMSAISIEKFCRRHPNVNTIPLFVAQTNVSRAPTEPSMPRHTNWHTLTPTRAFSVGA